MSVCMQTSPPLSSRAKRSDASRNAKSRDLQFHLFLNYLILLCLLSAKSFTQELPKGWRRPSPAEASGKWRQKSPTRFLVVKGDFDGDGKPDVAEVFVNPSESRFSIFVRLHAVDRWQKAGHETEIKWLEEMGISLVKPGRYETACGKGYDDSFCAHGEPDYLRLSANGIDFFVQESADSIIYWDKTNRTFQTIQMSD
jgi:hypothetical protein